MLEILKSLYADVEGQGLVEYSLILVLIVVVSILALKLLGVNLTIKYNNISNNL